MFIIVKSHDFILKIIIEQMKQDSSIPLLFIFIDIRTEKPHSHFLKN